MAAYINGIGLISPQHTFGDVPFLETPSAYTDSKLLNKEPDYSHWIDSKAIRRMSRILKMGVTTAALALKEAGLQKPESIITGTALGCMEDTGIFLTKMVENNEEALNPTPFIQSTHNTIGSQVALLLQCQGYNQTYSHRGFSFEHALLDGLMMIGENQDNVLVGGVDELTNISHDIMTRFGLFQTRPVSSLSLFDNPAAGTLQGEGAAYFLLSNKKASNTYAEIITTSTFYKPENNTTIENKIEAFLTGQSLAASDIDLLLVGKDGDATRDQVYDTVIRNVFSSATSIGVYKHLCGEYPTANGFALWLGAKILKTKMLPAVILQRGQVTAPQRILIYNQYRGSHHSLILLQSC